MNDESLSIKEYIKELFSIVQAGYLAETGTYRTLQESALKQRSDDLANSLERRFREVQNNNDSLDRQVNERINLLDTAHNKALTAEATRLAAHFNDAERRAVETATQVKSLVDSEILALSEFTKAELKSAVNQGPILMKMYDEKIAALQTLIETKFHASQLAIIKAEEAVSERFTAANHVQEMAEKDRREFARAPTMEAKFEQAREEREQQRLQIGKISETVSNIRGQIVAYAAAAAAFGGL